MTLRRLFRSDSQNILAIEEEVHVSPWSMETFEACFEAGFDGWALEIDGEVSGFIIISVRAGECHILNICVSRKHQYQGWGRQLMEQALTYARRQGIGIAYLEVRRSNQHAINLYKKMNFLAVGERKDYYPGPAGQEDALIFAKSLVPT